MVEATHAVERRQANLGRWEMGAFLVGFIGLVICIALMLSNDPDVKGPMAQSYLWAFVFWGGLTLGCFSVNLLSHSVRAAWGTGIMRILDAGGGPIALGGMFALFIPVAYLFMSGTPIIYAWADPAVVANDAVLQHKAPYLNPMFVLIRAILFFAAWFFLARYLRKSTFKQDQSLDEQEARNRVNWASPGLVLFFITCTFAFTDWIMSIDEHWFSTMYGPWLIIGNALAAFTLCTAIVCYNAKREPYASIVTPNFTKDLGNLILTNLLLWTYVSFSQYLIIWSGNIPEFTQYYVERADGAWMLIPVSMIFLHFLIPFVALLNPVNKRKPRNLMFIAIWIFLMRIVDTYWIVTGGFTDREYPLQPWMSDLLAFGAVGLIWLALFSTGIKRGSLLPVFDQRLKEAAAHDHHA